jgi:hypothetical protein
MFFSVSAATEKVATLVLPGTVRARITSCKMMLPDYRSISAKAARAGGARLISLARAIDRRSLVRDGSEILAIVLDSPLPQEKDCGRID